LFFFRAIFSIFLPLFLLLLSLLSLPVLDPNMADPRVTDFNLSLPSSAVGVGSSTKKPKKKKKKKKKKILTAFFSFLNPQTASVMWSHKCN